MKRFHALCHRLLAGAAALALVAGFTAGARADVAYSFAQAQVSGLNVSVNGATISNVSGSFLTQTGATLTGFPAAGSPGSYDAPQALINAASAENNFNKLATFGSSPATAGSLPTSPSTSFSHGDSSFTGTPPITNLFTSTGVAVNSVAESYLNTSSGTNLATGNGGWSVTATFTISAATAPVALNIGYGYANDIYSATSATGTNVASAQSNFSFSYTIKNVGTDNGPAALSGNFGAPPNTQNEQINSGTNLTYTSSTLPALGNGTYTITITGNTQSFVQIEAIPEPGPLALAAVAGSLVGLAGLKRKFGRKVQA